MPPLARPPPRPAHRPLADPQLRPHRPATAGPALGPLPVPAGPTVRKGGERRPPPRGTGARGGETRCPLATPRSPGGQGCAQLSSAPHAGLLPASRTPAAVPGRAGAREPQVPQRGQDRAGRLQGSRRWGRAGGRRQRAAPRRAERCAPGRQSRWQDPRREGQGLPAAPQSPAEKTSPYLGCAATGTSRNVPASPQRPRRARSPGPPAGDGAGSRAEAAGGAEAARPPPAGGGPGPRRHRPAASPPRPLAPACSGRSACPGHTRWATGAECGPAVVRAARAGGSVLGQRSLPGRALEAGKRPVRISPGWPSAGASHGKSCVGPQLFGEGWN